MPTKSDLNFVKRPAIGCVILAAGGSRRLGRAKQLVRFENQTLLERTIVAALATPGLWPVIVVLGAEVASIKPTLVRFPVLIVENPAWTEGIASSLRCGLEILNQFSPKIGHTLISLCDQPFLQTRTFEHLIAQQHQTGSPLVAARYDNHPGAPALFSRNYFSALAGLTGDEGARTLFKSLPISEIHTVDFPELGIDIDTPEDLAKLTDATV
jgi:molybdenum cofactor cytidylyltransferase